MVVKRKKVDNRMFVPKSYGNHNSKQANTDSLKAMVCKEIRERLNLQKSIDRIEKSLRASNNSICKAKSSVRRLVRQFNNGIERNILNFTKASVDNPFSKYGVLMDDYKPKPRRKINSAPTFCDYMEPLIQKIDTTLEEDKIIRDTTGEAADNLDKFPLSLDDIERRVSNTAYFSSNQDEDFNFNNFRESYRRSLGLDTIQSHKTNSSNFTKDYSRKSTDLSTKDFTSDFTKDFNKDYSKDFTKDFNNEFISDFTKDLAKNLTNGFTKDFTTNNTSDFSKNLTSDFNKDHPKDYNQEYVDTSRDYKAEFLLNADSFKLDPLFANTDRTYKSDTDRTFKSDTDGTFKSDAEETYKSDTDQSATSREVKSTMFEFESPDVVMRRLYVCTRNAFFDRSDKRPFIRERSDDDSPAAELARRTILSLNPSRTCLDLMQKLDDLASSGPKISPNFYPRDKCSLPNPITMSNLLSRNRRNNSCYDIKSRFGSFKKVNRRSVNYYSRRRSSTDYEESTFDTTPNKYSGRRELEDDALRVSTESARRVLRRIRASRRPVHPYNTNDEFMLTDSEDYAFINTKYGRIIYSPKLHDDKYMYRFVVLTNEAQEAVELLSTKGFDLSASKRLLTENQIMQELGIRMSRGWQHYFYFKDAQKELILRKRL